MSDEGHALTLAGLCVLGVICALLLAFYAPPGTPRPVFHHKAYCAGEEGRFPMHPCAWDDEREVWQI